MTEDLLKKKIPLHIDGMWVAMMNLMIEMDRPCMTIEALRGSRPATQFRGQMIAFKRWLKDAIQSAPHMQPEEKKFLQFYFDECDRAEAACGEHACGEHLKGTR